MSLCDIVNHNRAKSRFAKTIDDPGERLRCDHRPEQDRQLTADPGEYPRCDHRPEQDRQLSGTPGPAEENMETLKCLPQKGLIIYNCTFEFILKIPRL